ncbi:MAG: hypothetical protein H7201_04315 [Candidatus Saccharibacteria bacterium]|nr:hypothetical protein [Microbacteriaceae bacterium]
MIPNTSARRGSIAFSIAIAALIALSVLLSLIGVPLLLEIALAAVPWVIVVDRRVGDAIAVPAVMLTALLAVVGTLMVTGGLQVDLTVGLAISFGLIGLAGVLTMLRVERNSPLVLSDLLARWLAPCAGAVVWFGAMGIAQLVPAASRLSWAMNGDAANNFLFAREVIRHGGIAVGASENPVPLPAALLAVGMSAGRPTVPVGDLVEHDMTTFAQVWALFIGLTCVLMGAAVSSAISSERRVAVAVVGALASLIPLSWYVTGYAIEYGFFNIHLALPVVLSAWIVFLAGRDRPVATLSVLFIACTILLSVWGPLVLFPAALAVASFLRSRRGILAARGIRLIVLLLSVAQLIAYGLIVTLPTLLAQGGYLGAAGGAYGFSRWILPGLVSVSLILALKLRRRSAKPILGGWTAMSVAAVLGLAVLAFAARGTPNPLASYYPLKYAWIAGIMAMVVVAGYASAVAVHWFTKRIAASIAVALVAVGTVAYVVAAPTNRSGYLTENPVQRILSGGFLRSGDRTADVIFSLSDPENRGILWQSGVQYESTIDFWLLQIRADSMAQKQEMRVLAYLYDPKKISDLCSITEGLGPGTSVYTQDRSLDGLLRAECPATSAMVIVGPPR